MIGVTWRRDQAAESFVCTLKAIEAAGGVPVPLPMARAAFLTYGEDGRLAEGTDAHGALTPEAAAAVRSRDWRDSDAPALLRGLPAVVFPGGEDISPALFTPPQPMEVDEGFSPERDVSDFLLMSGCLALGLPVLAICRGIQVLGVVSGAEMIQDIPAHLRRLGRGYAFDHRNAPPPPGVHRDFAFHDVRVTAADSLLGRIAGTDVIRDAPSWHHQAVGSVAGTALRVTAVHETSGVELIEAVERVDQDFALGLQFHPEIAVVRGPDRLSLAWFTAIVEAARARETH